MAQYIGPTASMENILRKLFDLGAQVSSISPGFYELLTLEVHPLGRLLELEGKAVLPFWTWDMYGLIYRSQV